MKSPITGKEMSVCQETRTVNYRGETYSYTACFYLCEDSGEHFTTTAFDTEAMEQVYRQYRERNFIPSPEEIKAIRMRYRVSAAKMSRILGFGTNQYRLYENGEMPSLSNARLITLVSEKDNFEKLKALEADSRSGRGPSEAKGTAGGSK